MKLMQRGPTWYVEFRADAADMRPTTVLDDVRDVSLDHVVLPHSEGVPAIVLKNVTGFSAESNPGLANVPRSGPIRHESL